MTAETALTGPEQAFATGALHLRGMVLAGLLKDPTEAQRHIHAAWTAAEEFPRDLQIHVGDSDLWVLLVMVGRVAAQGA